VQIPLAGHFGPDVGRGMEDAVESLLKGIGYRLSLTRGQKFGIDIIADFTGEPSFAGKKINKCVLVRPSYAPTGQTAFSLKRGDFKEKDLDELEKKINKAKSTPELDKLDGGVMVTNYMKTEGEIDRVWKEKSIHCWDIRRLIFYTVKANEILNLATTGRAREYSLSESKTSALIQTSEKITEFALAAKIAVFVDDHDPERDIGEPFVTSVLSEIRSKYLKPIVESTNLDVQASLRFHFLGRVSQNVIVDSHIEYGQKEAGSPIIFLGPPRVFHYAAAAWSQLFQF
jgi:hypothetical protein